MGHGQTVAITGAAGTVGGYLVEQLRAKGYRVIAIDRPQSPLASEQDGVVWRPGDLTDRDFCFRCLEGADHVIHCAAVIDISWSYERLKPINVEAVEYLYDAARQHRLQTFVHFSSGSIYGQDGKWITETSPLEPASPYEQSKIDSEEVLRRFHGKGGPAYVILRPSLIYGPRGRLLGAALAAVPPLVLMFTGEPTLGFFGGPRLNWVHAEDVARAAVFAMENQSCWGEAFNVADDTPLPIGEVLNAVTRAYGLTVGPVVPVPPIWLSRLFYPLIDTDLFFQALNGTLVPLWGMIRSRYGLKDELQARMERETATYFIRDVLFDNSKLRQAGFSFRWPDIRQGIGPVIQWYQDHQWVPRLPDETVVDAPSSWGFQFQQRLVGTFSTVDGRLRDHPLEFTVTAQAPNVRQFARDNLTTLHGSVSLPGITSQAELNGVLEMSVFRNGCFVYEFEFKADDGHRYRFRGVEKIQPINPLETMTTMEITLTDLAGQLVATGIARFDLRHDLLRLLSSFRPQY